MRLPRWQFRLVAGLAGSALVLYAIRWFAFPGAQLHNEMWRFLVGDIAFLFLQVVLVTLVIDEVIQKNRTDELRQKLNMVVGAFFAQTGTGLLRLLATTDRDIAHVRTDLVPNASWTAADYERAREGFAKHDLALDLTPKLLGDLRTALTRDRTYLLGLITNQSLLEHLSFTDLLWAVTHLSEELDARPDLSALPEADLAHLAVDSKRAFSALGAEWLGYMEHLQTNYPHLFSLAVRTNPFDPEARVEISG